jgi:hypothetical protein
MLPSGASTAPPQTIPIADLTASSHFALEAAIVAGVVITAVANASSNLRGVQWTAQLSTHASDDGRARLVLTTAVSPRTVGGLTFIEPWELVVGIDVQATGRCLPPEHREQLAFRWAVAPLPPPTIAETVTDASFRATVVTTTLVLGNPVGSMTMTSMMAVRSLQDCVFSDVDPLDSSIAPVAVAIGPELGQYYRGAAIFALAVYVGLPLLATALATALRAYSGNGQQASYIECFAKMRFPSLCMIVVGILQEGLASVGVSLLRLRHSDWDGALGALALGTSVGVCGWALFAVTGSRLRVQQEPSDAESELEALPAFLRPLARLCSWDMHYVDVSRTQYKRRHMMLIDGLRCPWWTAVELASATFQGAVLGPRYNSPSACEAAKIALVVQMGVMAAAAVIVRPVGAVAGNVFLVLSKVSAFSCALLSLVWGEDVESAVDAVTSVAVGLGMLELLLSVLLLAIPLLPRIKHAIAALRKPSVSAQEVASEPVVMVAATPCTGDEEQTSRAAQSPPPPPSVPLLSPSLGARWDFRAEEHPRTAVREAVRQPTNSKNFPLAVAAAKANHALNVEKKEKLLQQSISAQLSLVTDAAIEAATAWVGGRLAREPPARRLEKLVRGICTRTACERSLSGGRAGTSAARVSLVGNGRGSEPAAANPNPRSDSRPWPPSNPAASLHRN